MIRSGGGLGGILVGGLAGLVACSGLMGQEGAGWNPDRETGSGIYDLSPLVVTATRTERPLSQTTRSISMVEFEELALQVELDLNLSSILAQTIPGMGPSTEAVSNFGQSLRGRNFLVLIDGVPQSTPLRDGFRDLNTIDASAIERIEVVRGGTALYGFGASGGVVNLITKAASAKDVSGYSSFSTSFSTEHFEDSGEYRTSHRVSGTQGSWDYVAAASYLKREAGFDSEGRRIPPDPLGAQGGFYDTDQWNLLGKLGYTFDSGNQRVDFMVNYYDVAQDTDYVFGSTFSLGFDPLPDSERTPAVPVDTAIPGSVNIKAPGTENLLANLQYTHDAWLGGSAQINLYYGDQIVTYSKFPGFPQADITSEKYGMRFTAETPLEGIREGVNLIWGVDYIHDETEQVVFGPEANADAVALEQDAVAGFVEFEVPVGEVGLIRGGLRHEEIGVDADTIDPNRFGNTVLGGSLDFAETLFNLRGVYFLSDTTEIYGGFSQGFSLNDLGRSLNDAGPFGAGSTFEAEQFESKAEKVDIFEIGIRRTRGPFNYSLVVFYSESDNGSSFDQNLVIQKFSEEIWGIEGTIDYRFSDELRMGATFTFAEGESETASGQQDLPNTRISPEKITAFVDYAPLDWFSSRLQAIHIGDRAPDSSAFGSGPVDGYTILSWSNRFEVGPGRLVVSLENLLNHDYYPAVNQAFAQNYSYAKGSGRRIGISYDLDW